MKKKWLNVIIWILTFQIIGFLFSLITKANIPTWYLSLNKSILTPPAFVFAIVWSILYCLLAIIACHLWQNRHNINLRPAFYCYFIQLVMNWAWTPLFFHWHLVGFSFVWIIMLTILSFLTLYLLKDKFRWLLVPYCLWLIFAAYLNGAIWMLN